MAAKITPEEWEMHKETILGMRRSGLRVRGKGGIVDMMKTGHGFTASPSQYELQLSKWVERKNLSSIEWSRILRLIDQPRETGSNCQIFMNGERIPERTLRKKRDHIRRNAETTEVSMNDLPRCVTVRAANGQDPGLAITGFKETNSHLPNTSDEPTMVFDTPQPNVERFLLDEGLNFNGPNVDAPTGGMASMVLRKHPLFLALHRKNRFLFDRLIECNITTTNALGSLCFAQVFDGEELWAIDSLLAMQPYNQQGYLQAGLTAAIGTGKKSMVDLIIDKFNLSLNVEDRYSKDAVLAVAMRSNDSKMVQHLLDLGADPRHLFCSPFYEGEKPPSRELLFLVLPLFKTRYCGGIKGLGATVLQYAIRLEDIELLNAMVEAKLDINARDEEYTPLGFAIAQTGHRRVDIVEKILMAGGDANSFVWISKHCSYSTGMPRRTALLEAISTKNAALVKLLINFGADIYRPARLGLKRTPLQQACEIGSIEIADHLLDLGVDVNEEPAIRGGGTSLQLCAIKGYVGIAIKLLGKGADVHAATSVCYGRTPLQGAAENGRLDMIPVLWSAALSRKFDRDDCERAMDLAKGNGHVACHDLIKELHE